MKHYIELQNFYNLILQLFLNSLSKYWPYLLQFLIVLITVAATAVIDDIHVFMAQDLDLQLLQDE